MNVMPYRVRLDSQLEAWIESTGLRLLPEGTAGPRRTATNARVTAFAKVLNKWLKRRDVHTIQPMAQPLRSSGQEPSTTAYAN